MLSEILPWLLVGARLAFLAYTCWYDSTARRRRAIEREILMAQARIGMLMYQTLSAMRAAVREDLANRHRRGGW